MKEYILKSEFFSLILYPIIFGKNLERAITGQSSFNLLILFFSKSSSSFQSDIPYHLWRRFNTLNLSQMMPFSCDQILNQYTLNLELRECSSWFRSGLNPKLVFSLARLRALSSRLFGKDWFLIVLFCFGQ